MLHGYSRLRARTAIVAATIAVLMLTLVGTTPAHADEAGVSAPPVSDAVAIVEEAAGTDAAGTDAAGTDAARTAASISETTPPAPTLDVQPDPQPNQSRALGDESTTVTGTVYRQTSTGPIPLAGADVEFESSEFWAPDVTVRTGADGTYTALVLVDAQYRATFGGNTDELGAPALAPKYNPGGDWESGAVFRIGAEPITGFDATLNPYGHLAIDYADAVGSVTGILYSKNDDRGFTQHSSVEIESNASGLPQVPAGTYYLEFYDNSTRTLWWHGSDGTQAGALPVTVEPAGITRLVAKVPGEPGLPGSVVVSGSPVEGATLTASVDWMGVDDVTTELYWYGSHDGWLGDGQSLVLTPQVLDAVGSDGAVWVRARGSKSGYGTTFLASGQIPVVAAGSVWGQVTVSPSDPTAGTWTVHNESASDATVTTQQSGGADQQLTVRTGQVLRGAFSGLMPGQTFQIVGIANQARYVHSVSPVVTIEPGAVVILGDEFVVTGAGFAPGELVDIVLRSTPVHLASVRAANDGTLRAIVRIPPNIAAGTHTLTIESMGGILSMTTLTVAKASPGGANGGSTGGGATDSGDTANAGSATIAAGAKTLANTGSNMLGGQLGGLAALLTLAGAALVMMRRRTTIPE